MKIYAKDGCVVFECDYCHLKLDIAAAKSKRAFMTSLNKFARKHDHLCKWEKEREDKIESSKKATDEILTKLMNHA